MANVMTKRGQQDNIATYEHFCDTAADMQNIEPKYINLGSVCVVLEGESGGLEIYIANSKKQWTLITTMSGESEPEPEEPIDSKAIEEIIANNDEAFISLNQDLNLENPITIDSGKIITVDLNNQNINSSKTLFVANGGELVLQGEGSVNAGGNIAQAINGGKITIKGGTYDSTASNFGIGAIGAGSAVEFNGGSLTTTEGGLMAFDGGTIVFNDGELNTRGNFAIGTNGSRGRGGNVIMMNGGIINAYIKSNGYEAIGIYLPNDDTFIMNNGTINVTEGAGIVQRGGACTIRGGRILINGTEGNSGWVGDNKTKMSESAVIYHETANYPAKDSMRLVITGGEFIGVDHSIEILSDKENPNVSITGGTFDPAFPE